jgi:SAM-dependent methyltransferase
MTYNVYRILDRPAVYALAQHILAPGQEAIITQRIQDMLSHLPAGGPLLDLGCGPKSWLNRVGLKPCGLDLNPTYVAEYRSLGGVGIVASGARIPFQDHSFEGVWSIGLLHHLSDDMARAALREAIRVCRRGGYVAILDGVMPTAPWRRPLATIIRKLDRGGFMRSEEALKALLPDRQNWACTRFTFAITGLEMLACIASLPH